MWESLRITEKEDKKSTGRIYNSLEHNKLKQLKLPCICRISRRLAKKRVVIILYSSRAHSDRFYHSIYSIFIAFGSKDPDG